ncbi:phospholipase D family protein [Shewanella colwelliana]|uniref:phospholipase D family protein n=1 Tax=Shewanella colwelliana TaxID=23 RepID=UPI001C7DCFFD|nr:phospholipase D family protein [Shewanella colwelliana]
MNRAAILIVALCLTLLGCASPVADIDKQASYKIAAPQDSPLSRYLNAALSAHPEQTGVYPLSNGIDAFIARLAIVDSATSSIDMQYYIYRDDDTGKLLMWHLIDAANRGVRVRILLDDLTTKTIDQALIVLASHPNIHIRLFNPSYQRTFRNIAMLTGFSRLNHRMHNKSLTADNRATIVGGRNIGNEYFSNNEDVDFGDFDLLTIGKAVDAVSEQFDTYWNAPMSIDVENLIDEINPQHVLQAEQYMLQQRALFADNEYMGRLELSQLLGDLQAQHLAWYWGEGRVVYDPPEKIIGENSQQWLLSDLGLFLAQAKEEALIVSPYFVPTKEGTDDLVAAAKSGLTITVVTNSLAATDVLAVHAGYQQYRQRLVEHGIALYEVKADPNNRPSAWKGSSRSSLHAKTFILDRKSVFVGSFNFDPRSAWINTELGIIFDNQEFASGLQQSIELSLLHTAYRVGIQGGELVWFDDKDDTVRYAEPDASFWRKFMADLLALLPIEAQL